MSCSVAAEPADQSGFGVAKPGSYLPHILERAEDTGGSPSVGNGPERLWQPLRRQQPGRCRMKVECYSTKSQIRVYAYRRSTGAERTGPGHLMTEHEHIVLTKDLPDYQLQAGAPLLSYPGVDDWNDIS